MRLGVMQAGEEEAEGTRIPTTPNPPGWLWADQVLATLLCGGGARSSQATAVPAIVRTDPHSSKHRSVSDTPVAESSIAVYSASKITWFPSSKRPATTSRVSQQFFLGQERASGTMEERKMQTKSSKSSFPDQPSSRVHFSSWMSGI